MNSNNISMSNKKELKQKLKGTHALFGASQYSWLRYDESQIFDKYVASYATTLGTAVHELACDLINEQVKLTNNDKHLLLHHLLKSKIPRNVFDVDYIFSTLKEYVNDSIGFRMKPEELLYFSENIYGTADAICFRNNTLRIHDLKTGKSTAKMDQLYIYAALYCLENNIKPGNIKFILTIYQNGETYTEEPIAEDILPIMDKIVTTDIFTTRIKSEG